MKKRFLSILLSLCMVLALLPVTAFAEDNEEPTETPVCTCKVVCATEAMNTDCPICGVEGATAENCGKYEAPVEETESEQTAIEKVQALIDALPDADTITEENRADVEAQLTAIDEAKLPLGDELDALDFTKYNDAIAALNELDGMGGAEIPETLEDTAPPDWVDASNQAAYYVKSDKTNITLTGDVTLTGKMLEIDKDVTLDLNGHTLVVNGCTDRGLTLQINSGCTLTLTDSSEAKTGTLSLNSGHLGAQIASLYGTLNANGGTITSDTGYKIYHYTGGIIQCTGASATDFDILVDLYGGTISGGNFNKNVGNAEGGTIAGGMFYGDILDPGCTIANGSHEITFFKETTDSTPYATEVVASGKMTTAPREPKKAHFIFEGWIDKNGTPYTFGSALTADVTLYANWTPAPLATVTKAPEAKTGLSIGDGQDLVTPGTADGGEMMYRLGNTGGFSETIPTTKDAGNCTVTVYYYVQADDDHTDSAQKSVSVTLEDTLQGSGTEADPWILTKEILDSRFFVSGVGYCLEAGTYRLAEDITTTNSIGVIDAVVTLDLNGHKLERTDSIALFYLSLQSLGAKVSLMLVDSSENKTGKISADYAVNIMSYCSFDGGDVPIYGKVVYTNSINGGVFYGEVTGSGIINGGIFYGEVTASGIINGGIFYGAVATDTDIRCGLFKTAPSPYDSGREWETWGVTFKPENGEEDMEYKAVKDTRIARIAAPVKDGFTFVGWYEKDANGAFKETAFDFHHSAHNEYFLHPLAFRQWWE